MSSLNTVSIDWLTEEKPLLLRMMASSSKHQEVLKGDSQSYLDLAGGFHAQAISQYKNMIYVGISQGSGSGKLWIYDQDDESSSVVDLPDGYPHPCCLQVVGAYMIATVEAAYGTLQSAPVVGDIVGRDKKSVILVYDLSDPKSPSEISRITQDDTNSGGAGLAYHSPSERWFILLDQDDLGKIALYRSTGSRPDGWEDDPLKTYDRFSSGAGLNLITASDHSIWGLYSEDGDSISELVGWDMTPDQVSLFQVTEADGTPVSGELKEKAKTQITNVGAPKLKGAGELLASRPSMRFGASLLQGEEGELTLLTCQRNMESEFRIERCALKKGFQSVKFVNAALFPAEMYASQGSDDQHSGHLAPTESWNTILKYQVKVKIKHLAGVTWTEDWKGQAEAPLTLYVIEGEPTDVEIKIYSFNTDFDGPETVEGKSVQDEVLDKGKEVAEGGKEIVEDTLKKGKEAAEDTFNKGKEIFGL